MTDTPKSYTRGKGLLEELLTKKRSDKANSLISKAHRAGRILDIGCGSYPYFLSKTKFNEKYGIDPSLRSKIVGKEKIVLEKFSVGTKKLPYKDDYFDVVTMLAVFEHIDEKYLNFVLKEIRRILKTNGILIITTPSPWADKVLHVMANFYLISKEEIHEHKHNLTHHKISDFLVEAGFPVNKIKKGFFEFYMNMWFKAEK